MLRQAQHERVSKLTRQSPPPRHSPVIAPTDVGVFDKESSTKPIWRDFSENITLTATRQIASSLSLLAMT